MSVLKEKNNNSNKLNEIFMDLFGIDLFDENFNCNINENLLGSNFKLRARDLIYLLFDVEKKFNINITDEDLNETDFNTINNILKVIDNKLATN